MGVTSLFLQVSTSRSFSGGTMAEPVWRTPWPSPSAAVPDAAAEGPACGQSALGAGNTQSDDGCCQ